MTFMVSLVFRIIFFPKNGDIIIIDMLSFCQPDPTASSGPNVPLILKLFVGLRDHILWDLSFTYGIF